MDQVIRLNDIEKDALKETANIGAGNASSVLSKIVNSKVNIFISDLDFVSIEGIEQQIEGPKKLVVGIYTPISGEMSGTIITMFLKESALALASAMQRRKCDPSGTLNENDQVALKKMGNILADSYLKSLGEFLGMGLKCEGSKIISTFGESIIDFIMLSIEPESKQGLLIKTGFDIPTSDIKGEFILLLTMKKIDDVIKKIKGKIG